MTTKRLRLLGSIDRKRKAIRELESSVHKLEAEVRERLDALAPLVSPVAVGDRLVFKRLRRGGYGDGYRGGKTSEDRYQPECWEVTEIGTRTEGKYGSKGLHWTATLVRIVASGERGKGGSQHILAREGEISLPHLYQDFKLGTPEVEAGGFIKATVIRDFRIVPAAEVER